MLFNKKTAAVPACWHSDGGLSAAPDCSFLVQTSFLRPNLLLRVVPKVREVNEDNVPLFVVALIDYIKKQTARAADAAAAAAAGVKQEGQGGRQLQRHAQQTQQGAGSGGGGRGGSKAAAAHCSGIVYCLSRKEAEGVAKVLQEEGGIKAAHYHAGMTPKQRTEVG